MAESTWKACIAFLINILILFSITATREHSVELLFHAFPSEYLVSLDYQKITVIVKVESVIFLD